MECGNIEIIMRKTEQQGNVSEVVLASFSDKIYDSDLDANTLIFSDLEIHLKEQTVYFNHALIPMTHHEFFTLTYLAQHPGWVLSKEQIYEAVWKESGTNCRAAVTNVVSQIRRKIGEGYIRTIVGSGYKFER